MKTIIHTDAAPAAIGPYSQAIRIDNTVYCSGQIPLDPKTMTLVEGDITVQARQVFANIKAVCEAAGGSLGQVVKLTIYLTSLADFAQLNAVMSEFFSAPFPARTTIEVSALPKGAAVEVEALLVLV